jgi:serine/threonine protein kinase
MTTRYQRKDFIEKRFLVLDVMEGGIGEVYLCFDNQRTRPCALKYLKVDIANQAQRLDNFKQTCALHLRLGKHPNIVQGIDYHTSDVDNTPFMVLEWVTPEQDRGVELSQWIAFGSLDLRTTLDFALDICNGLIHATKHGLIAHRDLKPDNILIGRGRIAKITDFGLAYSKTVKGQGRGTFAYMAPEMWDNTTSQDHRVDVYAIGCILYEMVMGKPLFYSDNPVTLREMHLTGAVDWQTDHPLRQIVLKCVAFKPEDRYQTIDDLRADLHHLYTQQFHEQPREHPIQESRVDELLDRALAYYRINSVEDACQMLANAIRLDCNNGELFAYRALFHSQLKRKDEALRDLSDALRLLPNSNTANYLAGQIYLNIGGYEEGALAFEKILLHEPNHWHVRANLGICLYHLDRYEQASVAFSQALNLAQNDQLFYLRALCYIKLKRYDFALQDLTRAIGENRCNPEYYVARGRLLYRHILSPDYFKDALCDLDYAIELAPTNGAYYAIRADIYEKLSLFIEALRDYDQAEKLGYIQSDLWQGRGNIYLLSLQYQKALDAANRALEIDPELVIAYRIRARAHLYLGQFAEAEADYKQVWALMPDHYESALDLCNYYQKCKNYDLAIHYAAKALKLASDHPDVVISYANVLAHQERFSDAIGFYTRAIVLQKNHPIAYNNRGICYLYEGDTIQAQQDFYMALRLAPYLIDAHINIGIIHEREGNLGEAIRCYRIAASYGAPKGFEMLEKLQNRYSIDGLPKTPIQQMRESIMEAQNVTAMRDVVRRFLFMLNSDFEPLLGRLFSPEERSRLQRHSQLDYLHLAIGELKSLYMLPRLLGSVDI